MIEELIKCLKERKEFSLDSFMTYEEFLWLLESYLERKLVEIIEKNTQSNE